MTGLFTYLMQSVLFTPTMVNTYVRESLALLNYKASVDRFGMFFLPELDMTKEICLPEVLVKDDLSMLRALGVKAKQDRPLLMLPEYHDEDDEEAYPIGKTPSWLELSAMLKLQPWVVMWRWSWPKELGHYRDAEDGTMEHLASKLFQLFTSQIWVTLNDRWKTDPDLYPPTTLSAALEFWTVDKLHERLRAYCIIPCNSDIHGNIPGPKALSFAMRSRLYFVKCGEPLGNVWEMLGLPPGYIANYREQIEKLDESDVDELHSGLETIFSYCQCLPNSKRQGESVVWEVRKGDVILLGNSRFYKLDSIGDGGGKRQTRRAPTHAGKVALQTGLLQLTGLSKAQASTTLKVQKMLTRVAAKKRQSTQSKNRRVPPTPKIQQPHDDTSDEDEDLGSDEDEGLVGDLDDDDDLPPDVSLDDIDSGDDT